ncbi:polysaccharide lyase family 8 super-sandwich domain-containing protein [Algoriphagus sp. D3-2-R+10]|uniref:polysaccharide lyase family 8 super-sandwich domain-containing protein n=1 Tax=Algoriphagus aurantiacus TaxID=3103948 RepID=UPI002B38148A|nr:polysaccharide lyase family 8 super-sandwich domain-containing protein [Algoriphagus sp. D3-2-R+10]MEB2775478.1 polysaccharide lyase family 8 super-sandwich domain-containing protein [Algoriphagus sp. D3-2-R+10]
MKKLSFLLVLLFSLSSYDCISAYRESDFEIIQKRIFEEYQSTSNTKSLNEEAESLLQSIQSDGHWNDINYSDNSMSGWKPDLHIKRLGILSKAYSHKGSKFFQDPNIHTTIIQAMEYWINLTPAPSSKNWWWLSISVPKEIGQLLIALRFAEPEIPKDLENSMISWMNKNVPITQSPAKDGSNLTDIAQHMIMQAVLTENPELLMQAVEATSETIKITMGDGIQRDMSFHAHGPELYIHGYGREYISGIRNVAVYTKGTSFSFTEEQIALISDFTRNGFLQTIRGRYVDFSVIGRGIARNNATRVNVGIVKQIKNIDLESHQQEYQQAIDRIEGKAAPSYGISPRHIYYWRSDYTVHHRPEFMVGLNIASSRTVRTESGNGENLIGHFLTEGATYIAVDGDEYFNIFPNWEWNKIPGTTAPENKSLSKRNRWYAERGNADFVGGVSDGTNGISAYQMSDYSTSAHKSWFFFDDKIICLGSAITAKREEYINTTLNQSWLKGQVFIAQKTDFNEFDSGKETNLKNTQWIYHDNIGYYFPENQNVMLQAKNQSGSWAEINANSSSRIIEKELFKLWINHGKNPKDASYSYILIPGVERPEDLLKKDISSITIISNSSTIQAVKDSSSGLIGCVFYEKGKVDWDNIRLEVNQPALVQLQELGSGEWKISLSEPTQKLKGSIEVKLKIGTKEQKIQFALPESDSAGSTVSQTISFQ